MATIGDRTTSPKRSIAFGSFRSQATLGILISIDGHVLLDDPSLDADGRARIAKGVPLRTTETSYFLQDKSGTQINEELSSYQNELVIERATGTLSGSSGSTLLEETGRGL